MRSFFFAFVIAIITGPALGGDGNRLAYLDEFCDPYYVHGEFPKLTTPQWVGEEGVEAVVVLAIDDMRDPSRYEAYLRPILDRLKRIDGRAPVSIMTCTVDPQDPQLQTWLKEGLSIECHTIDHPCPLLHGGDFVKAKSTYDRCVDLMSQIPGNRPVAFRMPCCDSRNTPSPRFWTEIFNGATENGNRLAIDSSVFCVLTPKDKDLPRELVTDEEGGERFRKYIPFPSFVNTIEDYPYPYIIGGACWEFPCIVPSDWEAQNLHQPNNPKTVEDLKAALDAVVLKQGVFDLVFHPHGWIRADQVVELIDHAVQQHGRKVKFLTFREAYDRLKSNLMAGSDLEPDRLGQGFRLLDVNDDGYMDVIDAGAVSPAGQNLREPKTRVWVPEQRTWREASLPTALVIQTADGAVDRGARFGVLGPNGRASFLLHEPAGMPTESAVELWTFDDEAWVRGSTEGLDDEGQPVVPQACEGTVFRDVDGDGISELIIGPPQRRGEFNENPGKPQAVYRYQPQEKKWRKLPFALPEGTSVVAPKDPPAAGFGNAGLRFVDVNADDALDVIFSNGQRYSLHLFDSLENGWSIAAIDERRNVQAAAGPTIPMIVRPDGSNNGAWFHSGHLWVQNEDTARLPDNVDRRSFEELLAPLRTAAPQEGD